MSWSDCFEVPTSDGGRQRYCFDLPFQHVRKVDGSDFEQEDFSRLQPMKELHALAAIDAAAEQLTESSRRTIQEITRSLATATNCRPRPCCSSTGVRSLQAASLRARRVQFGCSERSCLSKIPSAI
jgi:hypothetical protein